MLFLTPWFWVFAAVVIPVYWICPRRLKLYWVLLASILFHYRFAGPAGMLPIIVLAVLTYAVGLMPSRHGQKWTIAACVLLIGALGFYKYSELVLHTSASIVAMTTAHAPAWMQDWRAPAAPLAISFFAFEFVHYLYEVRVRGRAPIRNPIHFSVFAIFFPSLACGPIKRFPDFVPQLDSLRNPEAAHAIEGIKRIIRGLFKKVCIADVLYEAIRVFEVLPRFNAPIVALLALMQGFRIYYDFAGYTDIAIGTAQLLNVRIPENFNRPYWSTSLQDFWRRWHMSLSSWIRDYVYIPLGGNRVHQLANVAIAMVACGLWHGAAWHFAFWGVYHGAGLATEAGVRRWRPSLFADDFAHRSVRWAVCFGFVTYGWLLFFYPVATVYKMTSEAIASCATW